MSTGSAPTEEKGRKKKQLSVPGGEGKEEGTEVLLARGHLPLGKARPCQSPHELPRWRWPWDGSLGGKKIIP